MGKFALRLCFGAGFGFCLSPSFVAPHDDTWLAERKSSGRIQA